MRNSSRRPTVCSASWARWVRPCWRRILFRIRDRARGWVGKRDGACGFLGGCFARRAGELRSEVQAINEHAGTFLIESPGSDGVEDLDEGLLDVLPVIQRRDDEGPWPFPALGAPIPRLAMVIAIEATAQCRRLAMFSAGHDVNTLSVHGGGYTPLDSCSQTLKLQGLPQGKYGNPLKSIVLATEL